MATLPVSMPVRGSLGPLDTQNPMLQPLMDVSSSSGSGTLDYMSPAKYLATYPRVDATTNITVGGTVATGDTFALVFTGGTLPGGSYTTATYTAVSADTAATMAGQIQSMVASDTILTGAGIVAEMTGAATPDRVNIFAPGPIGNTLTMSVVQTTGSVTYTLANGGVMTGGSGPVIPTAAFSYSYNGVTINFLYGQPRLIGADMMAQLVAQRRPIF